MRKPFWTAMCFIVASAIHFPSASSTAETVTKEDLAPGTDLHKFSGLAGVWWLDSKCRFLTDDEKRELAWHISEIRLAIAKKTGKPKTLNALQRTAKKHVDEKYSDCEPSSRKIVIQGLDRGRAMTKELTGQVYDPANSDRKRNLQTFALIAWWYHGVDGKCRHMKEAPEAIQQKAKDAWSDVFIMMVAKEKLPQANGVIGMVDAKIKSTPNLTCNTKTKIMVRKSVEELFVLHASLKNKHAE